jgi:hypothetical protein
MGRNDDDQLHKTFMENHMAAALITILFTQEPKKLIGEKMDKKLEIF